jgi:hypothetical protein
MNITLWSFVAPSGFDLGCLLALSSGECQEGRMRAWIFRSYCIYYYFLDLCRPASRTGVGQGRDRGVADPMFYRPGCAKGEPTRSVTDVRGQSRSGFATDLINQSCYHQIVSNDELEQVCEARCGSPMVSRAAIQERAIRLFGFDLNGTRFAACERLSKFHIKAAEVPSAGSVS